MANLLDYARLVRLPNVFTALADIGLAVLATGAWQEHPIPVFFGLLGSASLYLAGMAWNDYFDVEVDQRERPFRPLPSGKISLGLAFGIACGLTLFGLVGAAVAGSRPFVYALGLAAAILLYDGWLKKTGLGPVSMGACRFLNILFGLSIGGADFGTWGVLLAASVGVYIVGVTWFARTEARTSNRNALAGAGLVMLAGVLLSLTVPVVALEEDPRRYLFPWYPYLVVLFILHVSPQVVQAWNHPSPAYVQRAVKRAVLGLILFDAVLASGLVGWPGLALAFLLVPAILLGRWVYST